MQPHRSLVILFDTGINNLPTVRCSFDVFYALAEHFTFYPRLRKTLRRNAFVSNSGKAVMDIAPVFLAVGFYFLTEGCVIFY